MPSFFIRLLLIFHLLFNMPKRSRSVKGKGLFDLSDSVGSKLAPTLTKGLTSGLDAVGPSQASIQKAKTMLGNAVNSGVKSGINYVGNKLSSYVAQKAGDAAQNFYNSGSGIHCLRCRAKTKDGKHTMHKTQKGGSMVKTKCMKCGGTKCRFVGKGFFDTLKSAYETVDPYVQAAQPYIATAGILL
jgi:hypothetical protein